MSLDLSKTSDKAKPQVAVKVEKTASMNIDSNLKTKPCCPKCKKERFEGFGTGYGPMRRCLECYHEWGGGSSSMLSLSRDDRNLLKEFQSSLDQSDALTNINAITEDIERIEDVRTNEKLSGANRDFWNTYWKGADVEDN